MSKSLNKQRKYIAQIIGDELWILQISLALTCNVIILDIYIVGFHFSLESSSLPAFIK